MAETLFRYGIELTAKTDHALSIRKPKLELGTVATDWSPAPEDEEELYDEISILQTQLLVVQGEISAKVWQTDIEAAVNGVYESMTEQYTYLIATINNINAQVGNVSYEVHENYTELTSLIANLQITADGIITSVSDIYSVLYGENILLNTDNMSMVAPWVYVYGGDDVRLGDLNAGGNSTGSWTTYITDGTLPTGLTAYVIAISNQTVSHISTGGIVNPGGMTWNQITLYWTLEDDIISDNVDKLVEGETYTFSFYLKKTVDGPIIFMLDEFFPGQTILDVSEEIQYPFSRNTNNEYIEIGDKFTNKWNQVSITFQLDSLEDFQICLPYGAKSESGVTLSSLELYLCGLSLMSGDGSELFATKSYVGSQIEQLSDSITTTVENYQEETASQIIQMADSITATVYDFEETMGSQFQQLSDSITTTVNDYQNAISSQFTQLSDSITAEVTDLRADMTSQIEQLAGSIKLSVSSSSNGTASIVMTVDGQTAGSGTVLPSGTRAAFRDDTSAITISAGTITFNSNTFIVNSTYFSVTASGVITATSGTIGGWTISDVALRNGPATILNSTDGVILQSPSSGYGGLRVNSGNFGVRLMSGYEDFIYSGTVSGYITGATNFDNTTGNPGVRIGGYGGLGLFGPVLIVGTTYYGATTTAYGSAGYNGTYRFVTNIANNGDGTITWTTTTLTFVNGIFIG